MTEPTNVREKIAEMAYCLDLHISLEDSMFSIMGFATQCRWREFADQILALLKENGYVKLADDQTKPINHWGNLYGIAQHDMEVVGWKKVVE